MKKIIALLLALVMVLGLAACGGNKAPETTAPAAQNGETPAETVTIKVAAIETAYGSCARTCTHVHTHTHTHTHTYTGLRRIKLLSYGDGSV